MDTEYLLNRRAAVIARMETLESVPGSGWHPTDAHAKAERDLGMPPLSRRPVSLHYDGTYYLVGPDVADVRAALGRYAAEAEAERRRVAAAHEAAALPPPEELPQALQGRQVAARVAAETGDRIELKSADWNACLYGLNALKMVVASAGVVG